MPSDWKPGESLLFTEWLALAGSSTEVPPAVLEPMMKSDALIIIDMQKDFVPGNAKTNPDGGRFGVAEGDHVVQPIIDLLQAAVACGATCVATRDYHPYDHVSFCSQGGPFPEHCVQGTPGAEFLPPIGSALQAALQARPHCVHVAFKAFHEDIDSFGGFPYINGGEGRLTKRGDLLSDDKAACCGCAACPWTGSIILKQSAIAAAAQRGVPPNPDAPPDILCTEGERGATTMEKRLEGCKRLFVCGLALDFCVLDTCLNARLCGFEQVVMVLDACRAAHIPGVGQHGTGFLTPPADVIAQLRDAGVLVATYRDLLPPAAAKLRSVTLPAEAPSDASAPEFPARLGPLGLEATTTLSIRTDAAANRYTVELSGALAGLASLNFANSGSCSPIAALPEGWPGAPDGAVKLRWAYPVDGMANTSKQNFYNFFLGVETSVEKCFVAYGGFLLLGVDGAVVAVQAIMERSADASREMHFSPANPCPPTAVDTLRQSGRMRDVTLPYLLRRGAEAFCWVHPRERVHIDADDGAADGSSSGAGHDLELSEFGAFLYTLDGAAPIMFHLINPQALRDAHAEMAKELRAVDQRATLQRALTMTKGMNVVQEVEVRESQRISRAWRISPKQLLLHATTTLSLPPRLHRLASGKSSPRVAPERRPSSDGSGGDARPEGKPGSQCCVVM